MAPHLAHTCSPSFLHSFRLPFSPYPIECLRLPSPCCRQVNFRSCTVIATNYGRSRAVEQGWTRITATLVRCTALSWHTLAPSQCMPGQCFNVRCSCNCEAVETTGMPTRVQEIVKWAEVNDGELFFHEIMRRHASLATAGITTHNWACFRVCHLIFHITTFGSAQP